MIDSRNHRLPDGAVMIRDAVRASLIEVLGIEHEAADQAAHDVLRRVMEDCGGEYFYVPKGLRLEAHRRDIEIWRKFRGDNHMQLAREYKLTKQYIYRIIARMRAQELARRHGS